MRDHTDAIEFLQRRGIPATRRVWALGDTVVVPLGPMSADSAGIVVYRSVAWLVPGAGGRWDLVHHVFQHERRLSFGSLEQACEAALRLRSIQEPTDACPECGGRRQLSFGERIRGGELVWFRSTFCESCGARVEADGGDRLPDDLRATELARHGRWGVTISRAPTVSGWIAVRDALCLDLSAVSALKNRIPCVAFEGTFMEALRVRELFVNNGASAELSQADCDEGRK
jgi:hypothetical protein